MFLLPGVKFMEEILIKDPHVCQLGLFDADWSRLMETSVALSNSARFTAIKEEVDIQRTHQNMDSLGPRIIMESDHKKKQSMVEEYVYEIISQWVGESPSEIDLNTSLYSYGLDSFFGLTLKMQLETTLQVSFEVSIVLILFIDTNKPDTPSVQKSSGKLMWPPA